MRVASRKARGFACAVALLAAVAAAALPSFALPAQAHADEVQAGDFTLSADVTPVQDTDYSFDSSKGTLTIFSDKRMTVRNTSDAGKTKHCIVVNVQDDSVANLVFAGVRIEAYDTAVPAVLVSFGKGLNLELAEGSENRLQSDSGYAGLQNGAKPLNITGSGELEAQGGNSNMMTGVGGAAGIGGGEGTERSGSYITISGDVTVTAEGGYGAAGIGGGEGGDGSDIAISGNADVAATGGTGGAGIGGGMGGDGLRITISGGKTVATGRIQGSSGIYSGAGIGGGSEGDGAEIEITGGTVEAEAETHGAAIGGGGNSSLGGSGTKISISGDADVTAKGGLCGAGIGGGAASEEWGVGGAGADIQISGGTVKAVGGGFNSVRDYDTGGAAGIGGGEGTTGGNGTDIVISGGTVTATGGAARTNGEQGGAGIGGGGGNAGGTGAGIKVTGGRVSAAAVDGGEAIGNAWGASDGRVVAISGGSFAENCDGALSDAVPPRGSVYGIEPVEGCVVYSTTDDDYPFAVGPLATLVLKEGVKKVYDENPLEAADVVESALYGATPAEPSDLSFFYRQEGEPYQDGLPANAGSYTVKAVLAPREVNGVGYAGAAAEAEVSIVRAPTSLGFSVDRSDYLYNGLTVFKLTPTIASGDAAALSRQEPKVEIWAGEPEKPGSLMVAEQGLALHEPTTYVQIKTSIRVNGVRAFAAGDNQVYARVTGLPNLEDTVESLTLKLNPGLAFVSIIGDVSKEYDGTDALPEGHGLSLRVYRNGASEDDVHAQAGSYAFDGTDVGTKKVTASKITFSGADADCYGLDGFSKVTTGGFTGIVKAAAALEPMQVEIANGMKGVYEADLSAMLPNIPQGCSFGDVNYELAGVSLNGGYYDEANPATVSGGKLTLPVKCVDTDDEGIVGSVRVKVSSKNYDFAEEGVVEVRAANGALEGEPVLSAGTLVYGEELGSIKLSGTMQGADGEVAGTFTWNDSGAVLDAGSQTPAWTFVPDDEETYAPVSGTALVEVRSKQVRIVGTTAKGKAYDGTAAAEVGFAGELEGALPGDDVRVDASRATAAFASPGAGKSVPVTFAGFALAGEDAGNYELAAQPADAAADIAQAPASLGFSVDKSPASYEYGVVVRFTVNPTVVPSDAAALSLEDPKVQIWVGQPGASGSLMVAEEPVEEGGATTIPVSTSIRVGGARAFDLGDNEVYARVTGLPNLKDATESLTMSMFPKLIFLGIEGDVSKEYDGTDALPEDHGLSIYVVNVEGDEDVRAQAGSYVFDGVEPGATWVMASKITVSGADERYYKLPEGLKGVTTGGFTGIVKAAAALKPMQVEIANGMKGVYEADLSAMLPNIPQGCSFGDLTYDVTEVWLDGGYYDEANPATVSDGKLTLPVKAADTDVEGVVGSVRVKVSSTNYDFAEEGVVEVRAVNGALAGTPALSAGTLVYGEELSLIELSGSVKGADGGEVAGAFTWNDPGAVLDAGSRTPAWTFVPDDAETYAPLRGTALVEVRPRQVEIAGTTAKGKAYDGTDAAEVGSAGKLTGVVDGDDVRVDISRATAAFASPDVGEGIAVTFAGFALAGEDAGNYELAAQPAATTADIAQAENGWTTPLSIAGWTAGEEPSAPVAAAQFGEVSFSYAASAEGPWSNEPPVYIGDYYVRAQVGETDNWRGLEATVQFAISPVAADDVEPLGTTGSAAGAALAPTGDAAASAAPALAACAAGAFLVATAARRRRRS